MVRVFIWMSAASMAWGTSSRRPYLSDSGARAVQETLGKSPESLNQEPIERSYQQLVQRQTFTDAAEIYDPDNASKVRVAYASFTPDRSDEPGEDLGYGFHIVKRLELTLSDGATKIIEVNEAWPENKRDGGLLPPDEIRIKTQLFEGPRHVAGSHRLFAYDSVRIAWGNDGQIQMVRRPRKIDGRATVMRVPVSAPGSCLRCHAPALSRIYAESFARAGDAPDYESIVAPSFYGLPVERMKGYQEYLAYLKAPGNLPQVAPAVRDLANPKKASALPELAAEFRQRVGVYHWVGDDGSADRGYGYGAGSLDRQGHYLSNGLILVDALEDFFYGKYDWLFPISRIGGGGANGY